MVSAGNLGIGTEIVTRAGPHLVVQAVAKVTKPQGVAVYNLEVEKDQTYFVGNANGGAWVHNECAGDHHFFLRSLGSQVPYGDSALTYLNAFRHTRMHRALRTFLRQRTKVINGITVDMLPRAGNSGSVVRQNFTIGERIRALRDFYRQYQNGNYYQDFLDEVRDAFSRGLWQ
jgi:hypothetical protein